MSSPDPNTTTPEVHRTPIPGVYIDPTVISTMEGDIKITQYHGKKKEFNTNSFSPSRPPKTRSSAGLFPIKVPGLYFDKEQIKKSACLIWRSPDHGGGLHLVEPESEEGSNFYDFFEGERVEFEGRAEEPGAERTLKRDKKGRFVGAKDVREGEEGILVDAEDAVGPTDQEAGKHIISNSDNLGGKTPVSGTEIFLHVFMHDSHNSKLTLNTKNQTIQLKQRNDETVTGGLDPENSVIQIWRYKKGLTLRIVNCGLTTAIRKGKKKATFTQDVKCHVPLPNDRWHAKFLHMKYAKKEESQYGAPDEDEAEHNAAVFARFMEELSNILPQRVGLVDEGTLVGVPIK